MAHLLPSAGFQEPKGDQYRFHNVVENTDCVCTFDDIPINIHDYRWTDYEEEETECPQGNQELVRGHKQYPQSGPPLVASNRSQRSARCDLNYAGRECEGTSWRPGYGYTEPLSQVWGCCPPNFVDPRSLIRPLDKSLPSSTRPTGKPYFAQDSMKSCPPHMPPLARKGGFNYLDWRATCSQRIPPDHLMGRCVPSLCTWCQPIYLDCCPDYKNPWSYSVSKKVEPYYY